MRNVLRWFQTIEIGRNYRQISKNIKRKKHYNCVKSEIYICKMRYEDKPSGRVDREAFSMSDYVEWRRKLNGETFGIGKQQSDRFGFRGVPWESIGRTIANGGHCGFGTVCATGRWWRGTRDEEMLLKKIEEPWGFRGTIKSKEHRCCSRFRGIDLVFLFLRRAPGTAHATSGHTALWRSFKKNKKIRFTTHRIHMPVIVATPPRDAVTHSAAPAGRVCFYTKL